MVKNRTHVKVVDMAEEVLALIRREPWVEAALADASPRWWGKVALAAGHPEYPWPKPETIAAVIDKVRAELEAKR